MGEQETGLGRVLGQALSPLCYLSQIEHLTSTVPLTTAPPVLWRTLDMASPPLLLTSTVAPEGYPSPRNCQSWSLEAELVLKPALRRGLAPFSTVQSQQ